LKLDAPVAFRG